MIRTIFSKELSVNRNAAASFLILMVCPLLSTPLIISGILKNKKWAYFQWAFFMGLLGVLYPPVGDLYRYTINGSLIKNMGLNEFCIYMQISFDYFLNIVLFIITHLGINIDLSRFLFNFLSYYLLGKICYDIIESNKSLRSQDKKYIIGSILVFFISAFLYRNTLGYIVMLYGVYKLVFQEKKIGWIFLLLSVSIHLSMALFVIMVVLQQLGLFKIRRTFMIIMALMAFLLDTAAAVSLLHLLPTSYVDRYISYLDGYWAGEYLESRSWKYLLMRQMNAGVTYVMIIIYFFNYKNSSLSLKKESLVNAFIFLLILASVSVTVYGRFSVIVAMAIKILFCAEYTRNSFRWKCLIVMFWATIFGNVVNLYSIRRELSVSSMNKIAYMTAPSIIMYSYDNNWISNNIFENGDFRRN